MILQADIGNNDKTIEGLRLAVVLQGVKVRVTPTAAFPSPETKLLVAMKQNLEILMTNRSINPVQGAPE